MCVVVCLSAVCHRCTPTQMSVQTLREGRNVVIIDVNVSVSGRVSVCLCVCVSVCPQFVIAVHRLRRLFKHSEKVGTLLL